MGLNWKIGFNFNGLRVMNGLKIKDKICLYVTSLWLFFLCVAILKAYMPVIELKEYYPFFELNIHKFQGWKDLLCNNIITIICLFMMFFGLIYSSLFKYQLNGTYPLQIEITSIQNKNFESLTFLTTYVIPLVSFDLSKRRYIIILILLLIVICIIYIKTNLFFSNPTLSLLGYKLYEVSGRNQQNQENEFKSLIVITKDELKLKDDIKLRDLDNNVYFGRK